LQYESVRSIEEFRKDYIWNNFIIFGIVLVKEYRETGIVVQKPCLFMRRSRSVQLDSRATLSRTRATKSREKNHGVQGWSKKRGHKLMTIILSIRNKFKNFFSLKDSLVNLQSNGYQKSHRTLQTTYINVKKQAINDKIQGSVAAYFRCGGGC